MQVQDAIKSDHDVPLQRLRHLCGKCFPTELNAVQICDYCLYEFMEKAGHCENDDAQAIIASKKIQCVYCWSRHTLTDM